VIPSYQEQVVPPGRYLVFTGFSPTSSTPPRSGHDECLERVDYYTRAETESLFRIVPGTDDRKFRGPTQEDNMIEVVEIGACDLDDHGWIFCIDDVRKAVREIQSN
jgi:hypothetical protein